MISIAKKQDWEKIVLSTICKDISYGYTASASKEKVGPKFLRITDIVPYRIDWNEVPYCEISDKKHSKYKLEKGDIVIARTGATTGYAKQFYSNEDAVFASYLVRLRLSDEVDKKYVGIIIESDSYKNFITANLTGAAQPQANAKILTSFIFDLPPLQKQKAISSIISSFDDLIENNAQRIKILEEMARLIYREWFVYFRFPDHEKIKMVDSGTELGEIPEGWEVKNLKEVASVNDQSISKKNAPSEISYVDIASVGIGYISKLESMLLEDAPSRAKRILRHGDVIWSSVRPNRKSYSLVLNPVANMIASTGFAVLTPNQVPFSYLYLATTTDMFVGYLVNHARGAAYPAVNSDDFGNADILLPTPNLLEQFHEQVEPIFLLIDSLQKRNSRLSKTRDLLLPKLISGQLDVSSLAIPSTSNEK